MRWRFDHGASSGEGRATPRFGVRFRLSYLT